MFFKGVQSCSVVGVKYDFDGVSGRFRNIVYVKFMGSRTEYWVTSDRIFLGEDILRTAMTLHVRFSR